MSVQGAMQAAWPARGGGPDVIVVGERPIPQPAAGQVLIRTHYAGVNRHDVNQRARGSGPKGSTDILGLEVSGAIAEIGADVTGLRAGDEVCALVDGGGYAQWVVADAALVMPRPAALDMREAAALPEALFTCWFNVVQLGRLQRGDWLLVHGGTSGVGSITLQVARALGAKTIATAGSPAKCEAARAFGADVAIDYRTQDFVAEVASATAGRGVDVILDMVGGAYAERNLAALAMDGRILHLASGATPVWSAPLRLIMEKRAIVTGSLLRPLDIGSKAMIAAALKTRVWPLLGTEIRPRIDSVLPLHEAGAAHARMESSEHIGKILLDCRSE
ncbi:MAG: NAD(P)H-quinone oxidoreductase [Hyphomicrobiales bacterium]|nr:NAD(P)H-quinone oxidoreductase [Hyphomicrobiales bacterium]